MRTISPDKSDLHFVKRTFIEKKAKKNIQVMEQKLTEVGTMLSLSNALAEEQKKEQIKTIQALCSAEFLDSLRDVVTCTKEAGKRQLDCFSFMLKNLLQKWRDSKVSSDKEYSLLCMKRIVKTAHIRPYNSNILTIAVLKRHDDLINSVMDILDIMREQATDEISFNNDKKFIFEACVINNIPLQEYLGAISNPSCALMRVIKMAGMRKTSLKSIQIGRIKKNIYGALLAGHKEDLKEYFIYFAEYVVESIADVFERSRNDEQFLRSVSYTIECFAKMVAVLRDRVAEYHTVDRIKEVADAFIKLFSQPCMKVPVCHFLARNNPKFLKYLLQATKNIPRKYRPHFTDELFSIKNDAGYNLMQFVAKMLSAEHIKICSQLYSQGLTAYRKPPFIIQLLIARAIQGEAIVDSLRSIVGQERFVINAKIVADLFKFYATIPKTVAIAFRTRPNIIALLPDDAILEAAKHSEEARLVALFKALNYSRSYESSQRYINRAFYCKDNGNSAIHIMVNNGLYNALEACAKLTDLIVPFCFVKNSENSSLYDYVKQKKKKVYDIFKKLNLHAKSRP